MEVFQKKYKRKIILGLITAVSAAYFSCSDNTEGNLRYGKQFYYSNCLPCHGNKSSFNHDSSSLNIMGSYDSIYLMNKLVDLSSDKSHKKLLAGSVYSKKEIKSLYFFIKSYGKPVE